MLIFLENYIYIYVHTTHIPLLNNSILFKVRKLRLLFIRVYFCRAIQPYIGSELAKCLEGRVPLEQQILEASAPPPALEPRLIPGGPYGK